MKVPMALAEMVSDFAGMRQTPNKRCRCEVNMCHGCSRVGSRAASRAPSGRSTPQRKMSGDLGQQGQNRLKIMVGAEEIPTSGSTTPRTYDSNQALHGLSYYHHHHQKHHPHHQHSHHNFHHQEELRRQAMSTSACAKALNEKLTIVKRKRDSESQQGSTSEDSSDVPEKMEQQSESLVKNASFVTLL